MKKLLLLLPLLFQFSNNVYASAVNASIQVTATLNPTCTISTTKLDFALIGIIENSVTSTNTNIVVKCSNQLPYTIGFSGGNQGNNMMKGSDKGETIPYTICQQEGYTISKNTINCAKSWISSTSTGTGNGKIQNYIMYGYVLNGFYTPDSYSDNVTASISY